MSNTQQLIESIKLGGDKDWQQLYNQNRNKVVRWIKTVYSFSDEEAAEFYQQAFTIFYINIKKGKLIELYCEPGTYLTGIVKNIIKETFRLKNTSKLQHTDYKQLNELSALDYSILEYYDRNHKEILVTQLLNQIGEPCKTILLLYYYEGYSMDAIAEATSYKNANVVKKKKCQCIKHLQALIEKRKNNISNDI